jgi:uncharacterized membrane protein (TIGR02234 family)
VSGSAHAGSAGRERAGGRVTPRRELTAALAAAALGAALTLFAAGQEWATITATRRPPLPPVSTVAPGGDLAPLAPAAALVLLAAAGALLAVRGTGRLLVGLLMAAAGAAAAWSSGRVLGGSDVVTAQLRAFGVPADALAVDLAPVWPVLAAAGGVLGALAGLTTAVRGRRWPAMGRRYERAGASPAGPSAETGEQRAHAAWTALDRGNDPTAGPAPGPADRPS